MEWYELLLEERNVSPLVTNLQAVQILWPHPKNPLVESQLYFLMEEENRLGDKMLPKVGALVEIKLIFPSTICLIFSCAVSMGRCLRTIAVMSLNCLLYGVVKVTKPSLTPVLC